MGLFDWIAGANPSAIAANASQATIGGIFTGVKDLIQQFHLPPEQELAAKVKLAELELATVQAQLSDTASARQMQMADKSRWPGVLTFVVVGGFMGSIWWVAKYGLLGTNTPGGEALFMLLQTLNVAVGMVLQFWFGSSSGSQTKDAMLYHSSPVTPAPLKPL